MLGVCEDKNYRTIVAAALAHDHLVNSRTPMDVNLAKQLIILIQDMGLRLDRILMDPSTGALGYGIEYGYSVMERLRIAALQGDSMTQLPMLVTPGEEAWKTKEAKVGEGVPEAWGDWRERALHWETLTATTLIQSGADIVVLRHPESLRRVQRTVAALMTHGPRRRRGIGRSIIMALTGLQIYKLLPQTNCKECGFPTCLAFAMKLAAKQAELAACPYVSEAAKGQLEAAAAPPIRLVTISRNGHKLAVGNETVLFRHEKTFYHPPGLFVRVRDTQPLDDVAALAAQVAQYKVDYVGLDLAFDGIAVAERERRSGGVPPCGGGCAQRQSWRLDPDEPQSRRARGRAGRCAGDAAPLLLRRRRQELAGDGRAWPSATGCPWPSPRRAWTNWRSWRSRCRRAGVQDLVLDLEQRGFCRSLAAMTQLRRLALKGGVRDLGFPLMTFPGEGLDDPARRSGAGGTADRQVCRLCRAGPLHAGPGLCRCWCCARTSLPTRRSRSRCSPACTKSTIPRPTRR